MKFTIYGSSNCPDTLAALERAKKENKDFEFKNISGELVNLKEFLKIRDTDAGYAEVKAAGGIGIPTFVLEDGTVTRDLTKIFG